MAKAYLVVICDEKTNAVINAEVWSSPEWRQSMCLPERVYILYFVEVNSTQARCGFQEARDYLMEIIQNPQMTRYHWVIPYLNKNRQGKDHPVIEWAIREQS